jgi:ArsR family transcriptional regulator, arsenate/arsenite/antimonite-responsive transcriptional repressor
MSVSSHVPVTGQRLAELCHALSDPTRLHIMHLLRQGRRCVCDLTETMDAAQSRLSFHLKTLRDAGLVSDRREGRWVYYEIRPEALEEVTAALAALKPLDTAEGGGGCCS